jgi:hypothetical protein
MTQQTENNNNQNPPQQQTKDIELDGEWFKNKMESFTTDLTNLGTKLSEAVTAIANLQSAQKSTSEGQQNQTPPQSNIQVERQQNAQGQQTGQSQQKSGPKSRLVIRGLKITK